MNALPIPVELTPIIDYLLAQGCFPVVVGGYLRDMLLERESKDIDIEVYAVKNLETLQKMLEQFGSVNAVGKSFGILKMRLGEYEIDFALPRRELKNAPGHRGFDVQLSGQMDFTTAALRRDFTINAIGYDLNSSLLLDPYGGQKDLEKGVLRCVNQETFVEDPLRILRAVQMAARFNLTCDETLLWLMQEMVTNGALEELPKERLFGEFKKLLLKASRPSMGFNLMATLGILELFPELKALKGVHQDPLYHPEGDVWNHTMLALDAMADMRTENDKRDLTLMLAVLCHDFGKPDKTVATEEGRWYVIEGHEQAGIEPTQTFLERLTDEKQLISDVICLVANHRQPLALFKEQADNPAIRRLSLRVNIRDLVLVAKADFLGRDVPVARQKIFPAGEWLLDRAIQLGPIRPLIQGRDLIAAGLKPSKIFKEILDQAFEAQIEGEFSSYEDAHRWLQKHLADALTVPI